MLPLIWTRTTFHSLWKPVNSLSGIIREWRHAHLPSLKPTPLFLLFSLFNTLHDIDITTYAFFFFLFHLPFLTSFWFGVRGVIHEWSPSHGLERLRNNLYQLELTHPFPRSRRHFLTGILSDLTGLATQYDLNEISDRISDHLKDLGHSGGLRSIHACPLVITSDMSTQSLHAPDLSNIAGKYPVLAQITLSPPALHSSRNLP